MQCFRLLLLLSLAWLMTFAGCGGSDRHPLGLVAGTVRYNGQPIASGTIIFEVAGARPANGTIVDGKIVEVTTYDPQDGAPVGDARIAVFATAPDSPATAADPAANPGAPVAIGPNYMGGGAKSLIPDKYNNPSTSGLTWTIEQDENVLDLDLKD